MLYFPDNIYFTYFEVSSNVSAHPVVVQCKILLSVLSPHFFENCAFVLCMLSASMKHFRILATDVLIFIVELHFCLIPIPMPK